MSAPWNPRFAESTRGRVAELLREQPRTIDAIARKLGLTGNAVRAQIAILEADGLVERVGKQSTASKPSTTYALTSAAQTQYSRLYQPFLTQLLSVLGGRLSARRFDALLRRVGRALVAPRARARGSVSTRVKASADLLNSFGGAARVERSGSRYVIRSRGCPLALATARHVETCHAVESLLSEFSGLSVRTCCEREGVPRCCFELSTASRRGGRGGTSPGTA